MNISKAEQRVLHALALGGRILVEKDAKRRVEHTNCVTREGWTLTDCTPAVFARLRKRRYVRSRDGGPYRITREGLVAVRAQLDQR